MVVSGGSGSGPSGDWWETDHFHPGNVGERSRQFGIHRGRQFSTGAMMPSGRSSWASKSRTSERLLSASAVQIMVCRSENSVPDSPVFADSVRRALLIEAGGDRQENILRQPLQPGVAAGNPFKIIGNGRVVSISLQTRSKKSGYFRPQPLLPIC